MIFPSRRFEIDAPLDAQRAREALAPYVAPVGSFTQAPWVGDSSAVGFDFRPNLKTANTFRPWVSVMILPGAPGARVFVVMRMSVFARVFMSIWLSMAGLFLAITAGMAIATAAHGETGGVVVFGGLSLFVLVFPILGVAFARYGFKKEADPTERTLREVLGGGAPPPYR